MDVDKSIARNRPEVGYGSTFSKLSSINGYSLLELMIACGILVIISSLGIPGFQSFVSSNRLSSHINALSGALALTRSEAVKRGHSIIICKNSGAETCGDNDNNSWNNGWLVFVDTNQDHQQNTQEQILLVQQAVSSDIRIKFDGAFNLDSYLTYKPDGSVFPNGSFIVCAGSHEQAKALIITRTGRVRLSSRDARGKELVCPS